MEIKKSLSCGILTPSEEALNRRVTSTTAERTATFFFAFWECRNTGWVDVTRFRMHFKRFFFSRPRPKSYLFRFHNRWTLPYQQVIMYWLITHPDKIDYGVIEAYLFLLIKFPWFFFLQSDSSFVVGDSRDWLSFWRCRSSYATAAFRHLFRWVKGWAHR